MPRKFKSVPFSCSPEMVDEIDERAKSLGMSRSAYIQHLIRQDLVKKGELVVNPDENEKTNEKAVDEN